MGRQRLVVTPHAEAPALVRSFVGFDRRRCFHPGVALDWRFLLSDGVIVDHRGSVVATLLWRSIWKLINLPFSLMR